MDKWVERYRTAAESILKLGYLRHIDFSGSTYLAEVYDAESGEVRWPFLQFDDKLRVQDAFCSCPSEDGKCVHLAAAYLKILGDHEQPLHIRFERSFWNHLCQLLGDHSGYEERFLEKLGKNHYRYRNEIAFEIQTKTAEAALRLISLIENRLKETPENSIKFSNLTQEEIGRWREGRPSPFVRYSLSFWADLAKWMMQEADLGQLHFAEDAEGYPTVITAEFPSFLTQFEISKKDLQKLIPFLASVHSPLQLLINAEEKVEKISFDPKTTSFHIEHSTQAALDYGHKVKFLEGWAYVSGLGFYPKNGKSLLSRNLIGREDAPQFLDEFGSQIVNYIPLQEKKHELNYEMYFDREWNWHFIAYLFEKGDLLRTDAALVGNWVYLTGKGFYAIEEPLFDTAKAKIEPSKISHFVNHHRIWLNGQEGFQTHLASIESRLTFTVTEDLLLCFHTRAPKDSAGTMDFGDWIYYANLGFFSKTHARLGLIVRPGLEVGPMEVSSFIKANREELEAVPGFFTGHNPLSSRGVKIIMHSPSSVQVKPVYTVLAEDTAAKVALFGDFVYMEGQGFCELPAAMRLPDAYLKTVTFSHSHLPNFFESELPYLMKFCTSIDAALLPPHQLDLAVHYLARSGNGLKAQFFLHTEKGQIALTDLLEAVAHKKRYFFF